MKKFMVFALSLIILFVFNACEEESEDPPAFDNGLMVKIGEIQFTADQDVNCTVTTDDRCTFTAKTSQGDTWTIRFKWEGDSTIQMDDDLINKIDFISETDDDYKINGSDGYAKASETIITIIRFDKTEKIIEAEFGGFIYKDGSTASVPEVLKDGYLITETFLSK